MTGHEEFAEDLAAYALDALDGPDRAALEAHLAECRRCTDALTELRRVSTAIGLSGEPATPPASLRARTMARATAGGQRQLESARPARSAFVPWMIAAASALVAIGSVGYTLALRSELSAAQQSARDATARVEAMQTRLIGLEQGANRLQQVVSIVTAPDVRSARLAGSGAAASASGLAYWSESLGLVFQANALPALEGGRGYELWVIPPAPGSTPVSLGMLAVSSTGTASHAVALPPGVRAGTVAVTIEAGTGSPTGQPTSAPVLAGTLTN